MAKLKVRSIAEQQGLDAAKLARRADIANDTVYALWDGRGNPTLRTLAKIAKALGCKITDLIDNGDDQETHMKAGSTWQRRPTTTRTH